MVFAGARVLSGQSVTWRPGGDPDAGPGAESTAQRVPQLSSPARACSPSHPLFANPVALPIQSTTMPPAPPGRHRFVLLPPRSWSGRDLEPLQTPAAERSETAPTPPWESLSATWARLCRGELAPGLALASEKRAWWAETARRFKVQTKSGKLRAVRISNCRRPRVGMVDGVVGEVQLPCLDRMCPNCQADRSAKLGASLRAFVESEQRGELVFVTLTQPKRREADESPREAVDRLAQAWRDTTNTKNASGRLLRELASGGQRSIEVTWSPKGPRSDGGWTAYSGWHAHVHAVFELRDGVSLERFRLALVEAWLEASGGKRSAQDVRPCDDRRIGQLCKYVVKPFDCEKAGRARAAQLMRELPGARLFEAWGDWRGWQKRFVDATSGEHRELYVSMGGDEDNPAGFVDDFELRAAAGVESIVCLWTLDRSHRELRRYSELRPFLVGERASVSLWSRLQARRE